MGGVTGRSSLTVPSIQPPGCHRACAWPPVWDRDRVICAALPMAPGQMHVVRPGNRGEAQTCDRVGDLGGTLLVAPGASGAGDPTGPYMKARPMRAPAASTSGGAEFTERNTFPDDRADCSKRCVRSGGRQCGKENSRAVGIPGRAWQSGRYAHSAVEPPVLPAANFFLTFSHKRPAPSV